MPNDLKNGHNTRTHLPDNEIIILDNNFYTTNKSYRQKNNNQCRS